MTDILDDIATAVAARNQAYDTLKVQYDSANAALDASRSELVGVRVELTAITDQFASATRRITELEQENQTLQEQLDAATGGGGGGGGGGDGGGTPPPGGGGGGGGTGGNPPPTPVTNVLVGSSIQRLGNETLAQATARFEALIGKKLPIARRYASSYPTTFAQTGNFSLDTGVRHRVISVKGNPTDAQLTSFLTSIPRDGFKTWVAWNHEPDNDGGIMTPTYFKDRQARLLARIEALGRADVIPTFILTSWLDRDPSATTTSEDWFPAQPAKWTFGIDPYDPNNTNSFQAIVKPSIDKWKAAGGVRWMVAETGTHRTGTDAANWITTGFTWAKSYGGCEAILWFDSNVGDDSGAGWYMSDRGTAAAAAFAAQIT